MLMFKVSIRYALFCSLFLVGLFFLSGVFGINPLIDLTHLFFDILIFAVFIFFGLKDFKTNFGEGYLHFWQGMTIGFFIYSLTALVFTVVLVVYFLIDQSAIPEYKEAAISFLESRRAVYEEQFGIEGFKVQLEGVEKVTLTDLVVSSAVKKIIAGFFVTPVISIILRKKPK